jgi:CubicO group peptidase (beta-lactamase class C family)
MRGAWCAARAPLRAAALIAAAILPACRGTGSAAGGAEADTVARVEAFIRAEMERQKVPGVAVAIVKQGEVLLAKGYGLANVEHRVPVRPETVFQSGSVGKMFTAAAVLLLVDEGKLALDDSIAKHLPAAPAAWRPITIRHLLTHTSGIPDYPEGAFDFRRDYTEDQFARTALGLPLEFPPGARYNYSNTAYDLLGVIVHKISGRFYGDLLHERVFAPLGMKTTRIISEEDIVPDRAAGYHLVKGELKNQEWVSPTLNTNASGSLYFSVLDLVAWERGLRAGAVLKPGSWKQAFEPVRLRSGRTYPYGFGWSLDQVAGQTVHRHGGSWQGFRTYFARYLGDGLTIAVLANLAQANPGRIVEGVAAILNPALKEAEPAPMPDRDPQVTARLGRLLAAAGQGTLSAGDFAYGGSEFLATYAGEYKELLGRLGEAGATTLVGFRELGDDRVYSYKVSYGVKTVDVTLGLAPDGKIARLDIELD